VPADLCGTPSRQSERGAGNRYSSRRRKRRYPRVSSSPDLCATSGVAYRHIWDVSTRSLAPVKNSREIPTVVVTVVSIGRNDVGEIHRAAR
jgi:hypothetical protein